MTNGYLSIDKFKLAIESHYLNDMGTTANALEMPENELKKREIIFVDVAKLNGEQLPADEDVTKYHSEKRNIGPFAPEWYKTQSNLSCGDVMRRPCDVLLQESHYPISLCCFSVRP